MKYLQIVVKDCLYKMSEVVGKKQKLAGITNWDT